MPDNLFIPSVDLRIGALEEYNRKQKEKAAKLNRAAKPHPCITISRQYGCQGYPVAELLCELMSKKTKEPWILIDRAVLDEVAKNNHISKSILECLGEKNRILDDILAAFSPRWKHSQECFHLLCKHVISLAEQGNVVIMELGGAIITSHLAHSWHFRLYGSMEFKTRTIAERLGKDLDYAEKLITREQKQRDSFTKDFLDRNDHDPLLYNLMFNNDRITPEAIARTIADLVSSELQSR